MDHKRLADKLLHEIASARAGITANYTRLWQGEAARAESSAEPAGPEDSTGEAPRSSAEDS